MSQNRYEEVADAVIAKKPELAGHREHLIEEMEMLDELVGMLMDSIDCMRPTLPAMLVKQPPVDSAIREETDSMFAHWGISTEKFGAFFGCSEPEDVYKLVAMSLRQQKDTTVDKEVMKSFIMARLRPVEFDILAA